MRKDFTPQIETAEITDGDLDNVSGGINVLGLNTAGIVGSVVGTVDSITPVSPTVSQVTGLVPGVANTVGI